MIWRNRLFRSIIFLNLGKGITLAHKNGGVFDVRSDEDIDYFVCKKPCSWTTQVIIYHIMTLSLHSKKPSSQTPKVK